MSAGSGVEAAAAGRCMTRRGFLAAPIRTDIAPGGEPGERLDVAPR